METGAYIVCFFSTCCVCATSASLRLFSVPTVGDSIPVCIYVFHTRVRLCSTSCLCSSCTCHWHCVQYKYSIRFSCCFLFGSGCFAITQVYLSLLIRFLIRFLAFLALLASETSLHGLLVRCLARFRKLLDYSFCCDGCFGSF